MPCLSRRSTLGRFSVEAGFEGCEGGDCEDTYRQTIQDRLWEDVDRFLTVADMEYYYNIEC